MKKIFYVYLCLLFATDLAAQARKPIVMVVPADIWCERNRYTLPFTDETGALQTVPDYAQAVRSDENLRLVISEMSTILADRGFPLKDMEQSLKSIAQEKSEWALLRSKTSGSQIAESPTDLLKRTAKADILLDLDFRIRQQGPRKYIAFNLRANDAYSGKVIASVAGEGKPSTALSTGILLEEAVLNYMDAFNAALMAYFDDMGRNGREIKVNVLLWENAPFDLEEEFEYGGETIALGDIIDFWMDDHCLQGRYSRVNGSENEIRYEQVRIPLFQTLLGKERAIDARRFITGLSSLLKKEPFNLSSKIYERGLGEVWLILGEQ